MSLLTSMRRLALGAAALGLCSCRSGGFLTSSPNKPPATQDRAGSVHIAVLSVAPWQEYASALQPNFSIDEKQALADAIPNTLDVERRLIDALTLGLRASLPTTTTRRVDASGTTTTTTSAAGVESMTRTAGTLDSTRRVTETAGLSTIDTVGIPTPQGAPQAPTTLSRAVTVDPFVRYAAATSLLQEVRLLQRYVRDVVIGPDRDGYVLRVQVTLMPSQRDLALDAYTTLSFFGAEQDSTSRGVRALAMDSARQLKGTAGRGDVRVVPIMVSDNIEGANESGSAAALRQATLGAVASVAGAALGGEAGRSVQRLEGVLGNQLNSLLTVGQVSDNTLRVRFGAMNQPRGGLGLVPRNQTVTVLVVVPRAGTRFADRPTRNVRVASRTDFFDARTGQALRPQTREHLHDRLDHALKQYDVHVDESHPTVASLIDAVQQGSLAEFSKSLAQIEPECGWPNRRCSAAETQRQRENAARYAEAIWLDIGSILSTLPYSVTTAALPLIEPLEIDPRQHPLAIDDGKQLTVIVDGTPSLQTSEFWGSVEIAANHATLASTSAEVDKRGRVTLVFPSPAGSGGCTVPPAGGDVPGGPACAVAEVRLCRVAARWESAANACARVPVVYRPPPPPKPLSPAAVSVAGFRLSASARVISASADSKGSVRLTVVRNKDAPAGAKVEVRVDGADVESVVANAGGASRTMTPGNGGYELTTSTTLMISLANLDESETVVITGSGPSTQERLQFRVRRPK